MRMPAAAHRLDLLLGAALAAGDDGAGVAHAPPGRGGAAGDEADDRLACSPTPCQNAAASSSAEPPISPIMMMPSVSRVGEEHLEASMNSVPLTGSPPMPTQVDWPRPGRVVCATAS